MKNYTYLRKLSTNFPRLLVRRVAQQPIATIIEHGAEFINNLNSVYNISIKNETKINQKCILAILNSSICRFFIQKSFSSEEKLFPYIRIEQLEQIPIPKISTTQQLPIIAKVEEILAKKATNPQGNTSELEAEIDTMVYELYDLTPEEIKLVEGKS